MLFAFFVVLSLVAFFVLPNLALAQPFSPGETIDPICGPADPDCYPATMDVGSLVSDASANSILFIDSSGNLAEDSTAFSFDSTTSAFNLVGSAQYIYNHDAGGLSAFQFQDELFGVPGLDGLALRYQHSLLESDAAYLLIGSTGSIGISNPAAQLGWTDPATNELATITVSESGPNFYQNGITLRYEDPTNILQPSSSLALNDNGITLVADDSNGSASIVRIDSDGFRITDNNFSIGSVSQFSYCDNSLSMNLGGNGCVGEDNTIYVEGGLYVGSQLESARIDDSSNNISSTTLYIGNETIDTSVSDARLKTNIQNVNIDATDYLEEFRVVEFDWVEEGNRQALGTVPAGLIAQEVDAIAPWAVRKGSDMDSYWSVRFNELVPLTIKAIQELQRDVDSIEGITALRTEDEFTFGNLIQRYLRRTENIFIKSFKSEKATVDELCIGNTCVTEDQLISLLNNQKDENSAGNNNSTLKNLQNEPTSVNLEIVEKQIEEIEGNNVKNENE